MSEQNENTGAELVVIPPTRKAHQGVASGVVAIEQERAIAEAKGQLILAKEFPRDLNAAYAEIMEACKLPALAKVAFYSIPQGGKTVTGASIKLVEQVAQSVTNMEWSYKELSRTEAGPGATEFGRSEVMVYAWDKQKNNVSSRQIVVLHVMDTKEGMRKLRDQRDIDNKIANVASKQMRGRLEAILPKWLLEAAKEECRKTLAGANEKPVAQRIRDMIGAFSKFGIGIERLEKHIGYPLADATMDDLVDLIGIHNALKDGAKADEYFGGSPAVVGVAGGAAVKALAAAKAGEAANVAQAAAVAAPTVPEKPAATPPSATQKPAAQKKPEPAKPAAPKHTPTPEPTPEPEPEQEQPESMPSDDGFNLEDL